MPVAVEAAPCIGLCHGAPAACVGQHRVAQANPQTLVDAVDRGQVHAQPLPAPTPGRWTQLQRLLAGEVTADSVLAELKASNLRGLGGAGFPAWRKWETVRAQPGPRMGVVNIDEGEVGTFKDAAVLAEGIPQVLEGVLIAAEVVGLEHVWLYLRDEYHDARALLQAELGRLQADLAPLRARFPQWRPPRIELRRGAGAYICGEESALIESLEGKRGVVRAKPPLPALEGFMGKPTVVNNVISLATVPVIFERGAAFYRDFGLGRSRGTIPLQIAGNVKHGGLFEVAFGLTLGEIVDSIGGGTATGRPVKAVQVGGPLGAYFPPSLFDTPFGYEEFGAKEGLIGHAGLVIFDDSADMLKQARFAMEFCAIESCGKCTPCRIGAVRGVETINRIKRGDAAAMPILTDLCNTMKSGSLCALGGFTPYPVMSALNHFPDDFTPALKEAAE